MIKTLRKLSTQARLAFDKAERGRVENEQREAVLRRILKKAIKNDPNGGVVMKKSPMQNIFQSDQDGIVLDPTDTTTTLRIVVNDKDPTVEDVALFDEFIRNQKFVLRQKKLIAQKQEKPVVADSEVDPYTDLSWIENGR